MSLITNSIRSSTKAQYNSALDAWKVFCENKQLNQTRAGLSHILDFLTSIFEKGNSVSSLETYRSAISKFHTQIDGFDVGKHPVVKAFITGCAQSRPKKAKYEHTWDVSRVLQVLSSLAYEPAQTIFFNRLADKLQFLFLLVTACRVSVLPRLRVSDGYMQKFSDKFVFAPAGLGKTTRKGKPEKTIVIFKHNADKRLCPYRALEVYLERSNSIHDTMPFLFVIEKSDKQFRAATSRDIRANVLKIMCKARVDAHFRTHSVRGASTSAASRGGLDIDAVMAAGDWASTDTFYRYYLRNIDPREKRLKSFQSTVLNT